MHMKTAWRKTAEIRNIIHENYRNERRKHTHIPINVKRTFHKKEVRVIGFKTCSICRVWMRLLGEGIGHVPVDNCKFFIQQNKRKK